MMTTRKQNPLLPQHPYACQVSGPSGCGKTVWIRDLLTHPDNPFDKVIYFYNLWQPIYEEMRGTLGDTIVFVEGLPTERPEFDIAVTSCYVFDDLMRAIDKSEWVSQLYIAGCHHQNLSIISLQQKKFTNRESRLNCHYYVLFKFPGDLGAIEPMARQLCRRGNSEKFIDIYQDATKAPYGWFLVDMKLHTDPRLRFRRSWRDCYSDAANL